jgi:hypothetical protein
MATRFGRAYLGAAMAGAMLGLVVAQPAPALEISRHASDSATVNAILLKGRIDDGDAFELKGYIAKLPKKATTVVYLDSPGGVLREGMRLGKLFHQYGIETAVGSKTRCASACALAFLGGRSADGQVKRVKASTGGLGFHSFSREFDKERSYSADDLKIVMQRTQDEVSGVGEYLRAINTDMDVLRLMVSAAANDMHFISNEAAIALNISVWDEKTKRMVDPAPVLERLARARAETIAPVASLDSPAARAKVAGPASSQADSAGRGSGAQVSVPATEREKRS